MASTCGEAYFGNKRNIRMAFQLIDMRHPMSADDRQMLSFLQETATPFVVVLTKADKLNKTAYKERYAAAPAEIGCDCCVIPFSALNGTGLDEIKDVIQKHLEP